MTGSIDKGGTVPFFRRFLSEVSNDSDNDGLRQRRRQHHRKHGGNDDDNHLPPKSAAPWRRQNATDTTALAPLPPPTVLLFKSLLKAGLGLTIALYVLNQKHLLPRPLSSVVSRALFWPTLPITVARRIGQWETVIDDTVIMGGAPIGFLARRPEKLHQEYGVRGVINLCEEYRGPQRHYRQLGMQQLSLPTTDHFEPTVTDLERAVQFIAEHQVLGKRVYVHCRAGHGRSAAVVLAWLVYKQRPATTRALQQLNQDLCRLRNVRSTLWKQRNIRLYHRQLVPNVQKSDDDNNPRDVKDAT